MRFQGFFGGSFPAPCVPNAPGLAGWEGAAGGGCGHHRDAIEGCCQAGSGILRLRSVDSLLNSYGILPWIPVSEIGWNGVNYQPTKGGIR